jgi:hypothetical protein
MEKKKILILAGIFLALLFVVLILEKPYQTKKVRTDQYLINTDSKKVDKITINKKDQETVLVKKGDRWFVENKGNFPADPVILTEILEKLDGLETVQLVSKNPEKVNIFEVTAESGIEVKAEGERSKVHFYIGKNGQDFNSNYVRREGSDAVYLTRESLRHTFDVPEFRSQKIFNLQDCQVIQLSYKSQNRETELVQEDEDIWMQIKGEPYKAKKDSVESLISALKALRVDDFVENPEEKKFENPHMELSFKCEEGYENTMVVAQKGKDDSHFLVRSASDPYQYKLSKHTIDQFIVKLKDLKEEQAPEEKTDMKEKGKTGTPSKVSTSEPEKEKDTAEKP